MADKTITFTQSVKYDSLPPVTYKQGQKVTLREDLAERWLKRGVATEDAEKAKAQVASTTNGNDEPAVEIPPSWRTMLAADKIELAKKLGAKDDDVATGVAAGDFIEAESKKREAAK